MHDNFFNKKPLQIAGFGLYGILSRNRTYNLTSGGLRDIHFTMRTVLDKYNTIKSKNKYQKKIFEKKFDYKYKITDQADKRSRS